MSTVLFTGAGGAALPWMIAHLKGQGYRVLAADMDPRAAGLFLADRGFIIPAGLSADFLPAVRKICREENVRCFIPLVDEELINAISLENETLAVLTPRLGFITLCLDKYALMKALAEQGVGAPETVLASEYRGQGKGPFLVKPRRGRGSRGVHRFVSRKDLEQHLSLEKGSLQDILVQELVEGPEFTISVVAWRDGAVQAVVPKEILSKRGITRMAVTRRSEAIDRACRKVQDILHADGPFNVQLCLDARTGEPKIFEINPRFSTSVTLTVAAGIDEVGGLLRQAVEGRASHSFAAWKEGLVMVRQFSDAFYPEDQLTQNAPVDRRGTL